MNLFQVFGLCIAGVVGYFLVKKLKPQPQLVPVLVCEQPVPVPQLRSNLYYAEFSKN